MVKLLIGAPIRQKPNILKQFLLSLKETKKDGLAITYYFVDDNTDAESSQVLHKFAETNDVILKAGSDVFAENADNDYVCDEDEHHWRSENIQRITVFKDAIIDHCIENEYDFLFLVDSDIVVANDTLLHLISRDVEIVSNVFWTQWQPNRSLSPQVFWIPDLYQQSTAFNQKMSAEEANRIRNETVTMLKTPGIYPVDGLGACTMIARSAMQKGVRFKEIPNLSVPGEDRHFCIRAGTLGIPLYMDTVAPVYHIYREAYLDRVDEFKRDGFKFDMCQTYTEEAEAPKQSTPSILKKIHRKIGSLIDSSAENDKKADHE